MSDYDSKGYRRTGGIASTKELFGADKGELFEIMARSTHKGDTELGALFAKLGERDPEMLEWANTYFETQGQVEMTEKIAGWLEDRQFKHLYSEYKRKAACPECSTRRVHSYGSGRVIWFGCPSCEQRDRLKAFRAWTKANLDAWGEVLHEQVQGLHWARRVEPVASIQRLLDPEHPSWGAYLHGPTGTGKTQQAVEWLRLEMERRMARYRPGDEERFGAVRPAPSMVFTTEVAMIASLQPGGKHAGNPGHYIDADYLILDDVGIAKGTAWAYGVFGEIVDARYRAKDRKTLFTSNLNPTQLHESGGLWDDRLTGRVMEMLGGSEQVERGELAGEELTQSYRLPGRKGGWW